MNKIEAVWQAIKHSHEWVIEKIETYPAVTFWCGLVIMIALAIW